MKKKYIGVIFGPNGVGKGTLAKQLSDNFNLVHINMGNLLRDWIEYDHHEEYRVIMDEGGFIDDDIVELVLKQRFEHMYEIGDTRMVILDGVPRKQSQVRMVQEICERFGYQLDWVMVLTAPLEEILERVKQRVLAPDGNVYHLVLNPPPKQFKMSELKTRPDDRPEVVRSRYQTYLQHTTECLEVSYMKQAATWYIDAIQSIPQVYAEASGHLSAHIKSRPAGPDYLYYPSQIRGLEQIMPEVSSFVHSHAGPVIHAVETPGQAAARLFNHKKCKALLHSSHRTLYVVIADRAAFDEADKGGEIYLVQSNLFEKYGNPHSHEWISRRAVIPVRGVEYTTALDAMIDNEVQVYFVDDTLFHAINMSDDNGVKLLSDLKSENQKRGHMVKPL